MNRRLIIVSSISVLFLATLFVVFFLNFPPPIEEQRGNQDIADHISSEEKSGSISVKEESFISKRSTRLLQLKARKVNNSDVLTKKQQKLFESIKKRWEQRKVYQEGEFEIDLGYIEKIAVPELPKDFLYISNVTAIFAILNQDLTLLDEFLNSQDYIVEEFNGFYQPIRVGNSSGLIEWKIYPSHSHTINSIRKTVYADETKTSEVKSESYLIQFYDNENSFEFFSWNDDHELLHFHENMKTRRYSYNLGGYRWKVLKWDKNGNLEKEWIKDDSKTMTQSIQRLKDRGVLDQGGNLIKK